MTNILASGALSRHITEYLTDVRGVKQYKCKTLQNPDYFFDGSVYGAVDAAYKLDTSTAKAGGLWLRNKGIVSVGTKKTDDAYKLFGMRPDENQSGSESIEWSVESIEINGKSQTINLRDRIEISPITTKFGTNLFVQRARQRCRIMVPGDKDTESFKISLRLHLKGCTVEYRKDLDEYWIYRGGVFFCRLGKPYLVDPATMNPIRGDMDNRYPDLVKHGLADIGDGEYRYTKEPTGTFATATLPKSFLVDADTVYSSTSDGYVSNDVTPSAWSDVRNASSGTYSDTSETESSMIRVYNYDVTQRHIINKGFHYFDTSGVVGTISAATWNVKGSDGGGLGQSIASVQQGTQADSLGVGDFDSSSGNTWGQTSGDWSNANWNTITLNATGIAAINQSGVTKTCAREYTYDYSDSEPSVTKNIVNAGYMANYTGTDRDPYMSITIAVVATSPRRNPFYRPFRGPLGGCL